MFPVTVRIYDVNFGRIMTKFLDMNLLEGREASTADVMFESVNNLLDVNTKQYPMGPLYGDRPGQHECQYRRPQFHQVPGQRKKQERHHS